MKNIICLLLCLPPVWGSAQPPGEYPCGLRGRTPSSWTLKDLSQNDVARMSCGMVFDLKDNDTITRLPFLANSLFYLFSKSIRFPSSRDTVYDVSNFFSCIGTKGDTVLLGGSGYVFQRRCRNGAVDIAAVDTVPFREGEKVSVRGLTQDPLKNLMVSTVTGTLLPWDGYRFLLEVPSESAWHHRPVIGSKVFRQKETFVSGVVSDYVLCDKGDSVEALFFVITPLGEAGR